MNVIYSIQFHDRNEQCVGKNGTIDSRGVVISTKICQYRPDISAPQSKIISYFPDSLKAYHPFGFETLFLPQHTTEHLHARRNTPLDTVSSKHMYFRQAIGHLGPLDTEFSAATYELQRFTGYILVFWLLLTIQIAMKNMQTSFSQKRKSPVFLHELNEVIPPFCMHLAPTKCEVMLANMQSLNTQLTVPGEVYEFVERFAYSGNCISSDRSVTDEVIAQIPAIVTFRWPGGKLNLVLDKLRPLKSRKPQAPLGSGSSDLKSCCVDIQGPDGQPTVVDKDQSLVTEIALREFYRKLFDLPTSRTNRQYCVTKLARYAVRNRRPLPKLYRSTLESFYQFPENRTPPSCPPSWVLRRLKMFPTQNSFIRWMFDLLYTDYPMICTD
ncbi:hypothetical protein CLF_100423 [Clonorchis sinensis]|uniref:Uncharacterized protein n=1 Tax=Clonorchis sinensis TaxID=79923 RepID=G7Y3E9_CLOSI|nr:hypothetical protein CLF_100423 [Clonorchis sinensis]